MKIQKNGGPRMLRATIFSIILLFGMIVFPATKADAAGANIPKSFFLEHPYSTTSIGITADWIDLDGDGSLWTHNARLDINLYHDLFGVYTKFPGVWVRDFGPSGEDDYDFGNIAAGAKFALFDLDSSVLTTGLEVIFPSSDDEAAIAALAYFRDFSSYVDDVITLKPYLVFGASSGIFAIQANLAFDIILDADEVENDDTELIIKYGGTASMTPELNLPFSTSFLVEVLAASSLSFDDNITGVYVTPGVRVGGQTLSLGAGVEIPFGSDEVSDFANVGVVLDLLFRFGS